MTPRTTQVHALSAHPKVPMVVLPGHATTKDLVSASLLAVPDAEPKR